MSPTASVVVITQAGPPLLRKTLNHIRNLHTRPVQIIVVDASLDDQTATLLTDEFPDAVHVRDDVGRGLTSGLRQLGLLAATEDVVVYLDAGAVADPPWLDEILAPYADPEVVAVGGRTVLGAPGEESEGVDRIGYLLPSGQLTSNFTADPGRIVEVDHLPGANVSYRRTSLMAIGGIRSHDPGDGAWEAAETALRLRGPGRRLVFNPGAVARYAASPRWVGRRGTGVGIGVGDDDATRAHVGLLLRVYGWRDPLAYRYARTVLSGQATHAREAWRRLGPTKSDGSRRTFRKRMTGPPVVMSRALAEVGGLAAGFSAAAAARRRSRRRDVPTL